MVAGLRNKSHGGMVEPTPSWKTLKCNAGDRMIASFLCQPATSAVKQFDPYQIDRRHLNVNFKKGILKWDFLLCSLREHGQKAEDK